MQIIKRLGREGWRVSASKGKEISLHQSLHGQGDITYSFSEENNFYLKIKRTLFSKAKGDEQSSKELLRVPGIGERNMQKLLDKGIPDIAHLKHLYRHKVSLPPASTQVLKQFKVDMKPPKNLFDGC